MDLPTLDKCPGYNLYIGGFIALRRPKALQSCRITHVVSVLDWQFEPDNPLIRGFQHLHIPVDDVEDEDLLQWFPRSNEFIHRGLNSWPSTGDPSHGKSNGPLVSKDSERGNGILIHCAMGKSRSATVLLAYLLWSSRQQRSHSNLDKDAVPIPRKPLSVVEALMLLRQGRPIAEPNEGFMDQLYLYVDMGCPSTLEEIQAHKLHRRWTNKRNVAESLRINQAPDVVDIKFEDDAEEPESKFPEQPNHHQAQTSPGVSAPDGTESPTAHPNANSLAAQSPASTDIQIKCRRCRHTLARSNFILPHEPSHSDPSSQPCAHVFLHPLSWMKETLSKGELEGRLHCPGKNCGANIGKFAWQGLRCSCGGWVTPGFGVTRGKVDEIKVSLKRDGDDGGGRAVPQGFGGVRMPPGVGVGTLRKGSGNL